MISIRSWVLRSAGCFALLAGSVQAADLEIPTALIVETAKFDLVGNRSQQQLVVSGKFANGDVRDVTDRVEFASSNPQVVAVAYEIGDVFVLCTDGVIDGLFDSAIAGCIRAPEPAAAALDPAQRLVRAAVKSSGRDNTTAVVVEVL